MGTVNAITSIARIYFGCNWYLSMQLSGICLDAIGWWQSAKFFYFFYFQVIDTNGFSFVRLLGGSDVTSDVRNRWVNKGVLLSRWLVSAVTFVRNNYRSSRSKCLLFLILLSAIILSANWTRHHRRSRFQFSRHTRGQYRLTPAKCRLSQPIDCRPVHARSCPWLACRIGYCCNCL